LAFKVPESSLAGDLGPPQAVYIDLKDALLASIDNSELLSKLAVGNSALCDDVACVAHWEC
jgi:hypothetical protein